MEKKDLSKRVKESLACVSYKALESFADEFRRQGINRINVFAYAAASERFFERAIRQDYKRKTTFSSDFAIAEWYSETEGVVKSVFDTFYRAVTEWRNNVEYFAEIILALNIKAWEMSQRGNHNWARLYSDLYLIAKDLYFDWYSQENPMHDEAMRYYYDYVD